MSKQLHIFNGMQESKETRRSVTHLILLPQLQKIPQHTACLYIFSSLPVFAACIFSALTSCKAHIRFARLQTISPQSQRHYSPRRKSVENPELYAESSCQVTDTSGIRLPLTLQTSQFYVLPVHFNNLHAGGLHHIPDSISRRILRLKTFTL